MTLCFEDLGCSGSVFEQKGGAGRHLKSNKNVHVDFDWTKK
jgi:hypothetical protein